tara:strand:+ start:600 stop:1325 length:726 start_codon:yes stop_codon:yes gene_type:complete
MQTQRPANPYQDQEDFLRQTHNLDDWPLESSRRQWQLVSPLCSLYHAREWRDTMARRDSPNNECYSWVQSNKQPGSYRTIISMKDLILPVVLHLPDEKQLQKLTDFLNKHYAPFGLTNWEMNQEHGIIFTSPTILYCEDDERQFDRATMILNSLQGSFGNIRNAADISTALIKGFEENLVSIDTKLKGHYHYLKPDYLNKLTVALIGVEQEMTVRARSIFKGESQPTINMHDEESYLGFKG